MGSYAFQSLANGLASFIQRTEFSPVNVVSPEINAAATSAIAETISWIGVVVGLFLLAFSTFWLVEAVASVTINVPKKFNVGFWAFVFPMGVYANAVCRLSADLNNAGFRIYGAICVVATILLWLGCALGTTYIGVWRGELFFAPGLEGWNERHALDNDSDSSEEPQGSHDSQEPPNTSSNDNDSSATACSSRSNGTYSLPRRKQEAGAV